MKDWYDSRFNSETLCDCGPLYTLQQVYDVNNVVKMFENTDTNKVLDCRYPPSCWGEFMR